ncbi:IMP dehydrogenase [Coxiella endosymbiont of Amblyomma sculptum]|uniref:IMP dehydrogenase n=1 Tax=Coxiella endosymbiont of Amblyomma sculptum TaxID=2487929 RepID=UPI00132ED12E|nr:IMP dehydrogenase [Coxiella endosymbiont of Amblyomma sculptum]QHG92718.1 IMP dehydrogenase [Coxiella endosymbiont of Amblyomma sculptum]
MRISEKALTFDDVLLLPGYSEVLPGDVSLTTHLTRNITLNIPLLSAAMDTVTEAKLAIALAEAGGIGILHKNMSPERQANEVRKVKKFANGIVFNPIIVSPKNTIGEFKKMTSVYNISGLPVVEDKKLVGIITSRDIRFALDMKQKVATLMTPKERLITVKENATREEIVDLFRQHRIEKLLMVNRYFELCGLITMKDILRLNKNPDSCKTVSGQLRVGAAIGTGKEDPDRISALVAEGVDVLVIDTAHGHSKRVIEQVKWIKQNYPDVPVIAGNIATASAARALANSGVDAVKVGIGPGSICITRIVSGTGVPQITAIAQVASELRNDNIFIIADGGVRFSGDICKAIAAGAHTVMIGGLFAGTEEAPGEEISYQGRSYKSYRGMGSTGAMFGTYGSSDRYFQESQKIQTKYVPEGIEGCVPYKGPLREVIHQLIGGLRSGMGYTGCKTIKDMQTKTRFIRITNAGAREGHIHDVVLTKESPNYSLEK